MPLTLLMQTSALPSLAKPEIVWIAVVYFLICAGIAVWASRRTKTANDFFVAGQGIGLWTLAIAAMAATLSGFAFIGGRGRSFSCCRPRSPTPSVRGCLPSGCECWARSVG
jgi:hypothetical protein